MVHDVGVRIEDVPMRIEFAPPAKPEKPKASGTSVMLMFVTVWAVMLGFEVWGPSHPPIGGLVLAVAQHWRETGQDTVPSATEQAGDPSLRAPLRSRAPSAAILGARQGY